MGENVSRETKKELDCLGIQVKEVSETSCNNYTLQNV